MNESTNQVWKLLAELPVQTLKLFVSTRNPSSTLKGIFTSISTVTKYFFISRESICCNEQTQSLYYFESPEFTILPLSFAKQIKKNPTILNTRMKEKLSKKLANIYINFFLGRFCKRVKIERLL